MTEPRDDEKVSDSPGDPLDTNSPTKSGDVPPGDPPGTSKTRADKRDDSATELVGRQLGDFRVLRRLGSGGMADVFLAEQVSLKRQVALKILKPELLAGSDDTHLKRFMQEATAAANLNHPHIVQVHAIGEADGLHFIAQEYVPGPTLRGWLRKSGPPEPLRAMHILRQVARALQAADEAGIVHRDIKPENILLSKKLEAKVTDFGLARLSQTDQRVQLTQVGITMGTPLYMSPEQVAGKSLDHRSDVYSLGVTAYQLLTGGPPFRGESALSVAVQHLNAVPEALAKARPDLPVALCELVEMMMEKQPAARYQHASQVVDDLGRLGAAMKKDPAATARLGLKNFTVARSTPAGRWPLAIDQFFDWSPRRHTIALGTVAGVLFLSAMGAGWISRPANPFATEAPIPPATKDTARAQYFHAVFSGGAQAYEAVIANFPNSRWASLAKLRLALIRLSQRDLEGARALFREMAASDDPQTRIDGQAGLALVAAFNPNPEEFRQRLASVNFEQAHRDLQRLLLGMRDHRGVNIEIRNLLDELLPEEEAPEETAVDAAAAPRPES